MITQDGVVEYEAGRFQHPDITLNDLKLYTNTKYIKIKMIDWKIYYNNFIVYINLMYRFMYTYRNIDKNIFSFTVYIRISNNYH